MAGANTGSAGVPHETMPNINSGSAGLPRSPTLDTIVQYEPVTEQPAKAGLYGNAPEKPKLYTAAQEKPYN